MFVGSFSNDIESRFLVYMGALFQCCHPEFTTVLDNKRSMGHNAHIAETVPNNNLGLRKNKNICFFNCMFLICNNTFKQGCYAPSLVEIGTVALMHKLFDYIDTYSLFHYYLSLEKGVARHLNKLNIKMCKIYENDYGQRMTLDQKSSLEPSAQVS